MYPIRFFTILAFLVFSANLFATDPPDNDNPDGTIELCVQNNSCSSKTNDSTAGATKSSYKDSDCLSDDLYDEDQRNDPLDVWYKVTVPASGNVTIQLEKASGGSESIRYPALIAYVQDGDSYTEIACDAASGSDTEAKVEITNRSNGDVIYLQVADDNQVGYNNSNTGSFKICAFNPGETLELPQPKTPVLSYYSNPVGNRLAVESPYKIQSLQVFDLMGKEVLYKTPNQQKLTLNTYTLVPGAYLLRVETPVGGQTVKLVKK